MQVSSRELGTNCWSPHRFCGGRCQMVERCDYPEKRGCKAVTTEVEYLNRHIEEQHRKLEVQYDSKLQGVLKGAGR